jgi:hypothetical protein
MTKVARLGLVAVVMIFGVAGCAALAMPSVPQMAPADRDAAYAAFVETRWETVSGQYPEAVRPDVEFVRFITPSEMPDVIVGCLQQAGHDATVSTDAFGPALQVGSAEGQEEALSVAWYACDVRYPIDPTLTQPLSPEEIEYMYDYNVRTLAPCLASQGHDVQVPSKQVYLDTFGTAQGWYPYADLLGLPPAELQALGKICPQNPPGFREAVSE